MTNNKQQTAVEQLIAEIKRRVSIIQSEPQTMARELMIENLSMDLEGFKEMEKEQMIEFAQEVFRNRYNQITQSLGNIADDIYNETYGGGEQ